MKLTSTVSLTWFLDGNAKRGNLALEHFEADRQFLILDAIHYFVERAFYTFQNGRNEHGIEHYYLCLTFEPVRQRLRTSVSTVAPRNRLASPSP
jgi:hypothetical protein